jgi:hypothetical protein
MGYDDSWSEVITVDARMLIMHNTCYVNRAYRPEEARLKCIKYRRGTFKKFDEETFVKSDESLW